MKAAAILAGLLLLVGCSDAEQEPASEEPTAAAEPVGFPEELACEKFYELVTASQLEAGELEDDAVRDLDVLALLEPVNEDGSPNRIGELARQVRDLEDTEDVQAWAAEFDAACD